MKKSLFGIALVMAAVVLLAVACSKEKDDKDPKNQKVAVLLPDAAILPRWGIDKSNLEKAMTAYGFNTTFYVAPETSEGAALQVEQLRKAINEGVKYIVVTSIDYKTINESGLLEQHPDVKVVCHDRIIIDNPYIAYISSADTREVGRTQAMFLLNHFHATGKSSMTLEILQGPQTDYNAKGYYEGAMDLLRKYIDEKKLIVKSGKTEYKDVKGDSWSVEDQKKAMKSRLTSYGAGECPDMVLAATDNAAQGAIAALEEAGITAMPVITGQDNAALSQTYIKSDKVSLKVIGTGTGNVSLTDVKSAAAGKAVIVGFDIGCDSGVQQQARHDGVRINSFRIIYELIDHVKQCMLDLLPPEYTEKVLGHATIKAVYDIGKVGKIAGSQMLDGKLVSTARYRILRGGEKVWDGKLQTLRHFKDEVKEVTGQQECGVCFLNFEQFAEGDTIECYILEELPRSL